MFNMKVCLKNLKNIPNYAYSRLLKVQSSEASA